MRSNRQWQRRRRRGKIIDVGECGNAKCVRKWEKSPFCLILAHTNPLSPGTEEGLSEGGIPSGLTLAAGGGGRWTDAHIYLSERKKCVGKQKREKTLFFFQVFGGTCGFYGFLFLR